MAQLEEELLAKGFNKSVNTTLVGIWRTVFILMHNTNLYDLANDIDGEAILLLNDDSIAKLSLS